MNVLFVSQCSKRALTETRRILDQFAERKGDRTWQTAMTQAGLDTLRKLLRKTARKNTAVACHWIRGRDYSELLWIVGDGRAFNAEGAVPTNSTATDILRKDDESTWHSLPGMTALTALAALMHDLGKSTQAFQNRLHNTESLGKNHYRHEWVSVRLFQAFVGNDDDEGWLRRLEECANKDVDPADFEKTWLDHASGRLFRDELDDEKQEAPKLPFSNLPPLARAVAWLILTHHRLPCLPVRNARSDGGDHTSLASAGRWKYFGSKPSFVNHNDLDGALKRINPDWNEPREPVPLSEVEPYWTFPHGLPVRSQAWRKQAARYAKRLRSTPSALTETIAWCDDPFVMNVSRLGLMLADHFYSSLGFDRKLSDPVEERRPFLTSEAKLWANTTLKESKRVVNQTLEEHLLGVTAQATLAMRALPSLVRSLPTLNNHRGLKKRTEARQYQWQDKAADLAASVRQRACTQGAFIVNMASTGCGKTLGNARIMNALSDPNLGMRCSFAIGLRTLTLQTGRSFQNDLGLSDDELAIMVGGGASRELFEYWEQKAEEGGSASVQALLDEGGHVLYEGNDEHPLLSRLGADSKSRSLLMAPLVACTVDHLMPATESLKGGRQIVPMLRLMSSDLVLDEPDDFDMADLPALTRLVHWAGLLGSRVLLSSATMPPALVKGLFLAYQAGRKVWQRHRGERPSEPVRICCVWVDEFHQEAHDCVEYSASSVQGASGDFSQSGASAGPSDSTFGTCHEAFVTRRVKELGKVEVRRIASVSRLPESWGELDKTELYRQFADHLLDQAWLLHLKPKNHVTDTETGKCLSFGLIRMANIGPLVEVAQHLYRRSNFHEDVQVHLRIYHSQFPLLARSALEQRLDAVLKRSSRDGVDPVLKNPPVREALSASRKKHHLFIVLGSPVTEVGRDHDYDWAVVEPSSVRSLVQLAGRVRRHRQGRVDEPNIVVLDQNIRAILQSKIPSKAAYCKPGFEMDDKPAEKPRFPFHFSSHHVSDLLGGSAAEGDGWSVDSGPRIMPSGKGLTPRKNMADMEHARMHDAMLPRASDTRTITPVSRAASLFWSTGADGWCTGVLPQFQRFRDDPLGKVDMVMLPDDDEEALVLHRIQKGAMKWQSLYVREEASRLHRIQRLGENGAVLPWLAVDLLAEVLSYAKEIDVSLRQAAERVATVSLPKQDESWSFHELLGFSRMD